MIHRLIVLVFIEKSPFLDYNYVGSKEIIVRKRWMIIMDKRLTWSEIQKEYPDQWVGLTDVEWKGSTVISAIVRYIGKTQGELTMMQIDDDNLYSCYTHPDHLVPLGMVRYSS